MLTTLYGSPSPGVEGDYFIYLNSSGSMSRVSITGPGTIELMGTWFGPAGLQVVDLVGVRNSNYTSETDVIGWPDGPGNGRDITKVDENGNWSWVTNGDADYPRGAETEIFAIYVVDSTPDTIITVATLAASNFDADAWDTNFAGDMDVWSGTLPNLGSTGDGLITSPTGSGGAIIGSYYTGPDVQHLAWPTDDPFPGTENYDPIGVWPGRTGLRPGVTVSETNFLLPPIDDLGANVLAIGSDNQGRLFAADSSAFKAALRETDAPTGYGYEADGLAISPEGDLRAANNARQATVLDYNVILGPEINAMAARVNLDDGGREVFAVKHLPADDANPENWVLVRYFFNSDDGVYTIADVGSGVTSSDNTLWNVRALDVNPADGTLWGVGLPASSPTNLPVQYYLLSIDAGNGSVSGVPLPINNPLIPGQSPTAYGGSIESIAFNNDGSRLLALDPARNDLVELTYGATDSTATRLGNVAPNLVGVDYIGASLYGSSTSTIYYINDNTGSSTVIGPVRNDPDSVFQITNWGGFTYDTTTPGYLLTSGVLFGSDPRIVGLRLGTTISYTSETTSFYSDPLVDQGSDTIIYRDIDALDYNSDGELWGVGQRTEFDGYTPSPSIYLVRISGSTVAEALALSSPVVMRTIAFNAEDSLFGIGEDDKLYNIDSTTGTLVEIGNVVTPDIVGMDFVNFGAVFPDNGQEKLYGVTASNMYVINPTNGDTAFLSDTGSTNLTAMAASPAPDRETLGVLYTMRSTPGIISELARTEVSAGLVQVVDETLVTRPGLIYDATDDPDAPEPGLGYDNIRAIGTDPNGTIYAVADVIDLDPLDAVSAPAGPYLVTLNTVNATASRVAAMGFDVSTLSFNSDGELYVIHEDTDDLYLVDPESGAATLIGPVIDSKTQLSLNNIAGMDFTTIVDDDGFTVERLYLVTGLEGKIGPDSSVYTVEIDLQQSTAVADKQEDVSNDYALTALAADLGTSPSTRALWSVAEVDDVYRLIKLFANPDNADFDLGRFFCGGTIAGRFSIGGDIEVLYCGFLWGNVEIGGNADTVIFRQGAGAVTGDSGLFAPDNGSVVHVGGTLRRVESLFADNNAVYTAVDVENHPDVPAPSDVLSDLEYNPAGVLDGGFDRLWRRGNLVDYDNDASARAQFISHPTAEFTVDATGSSTDPSDWYAVPLMAGETITLSATDDSDPDLVVWLYDPALSIVDSYGFKTVEDYGVGSKGETLAPMVFTAREAGIYYLHAESQALPGIASVSYTLNISGISPDPEGPAALTAALGGVNVAGDYDGILFTGTGLAEDSNIAVKRAGGLGGVLAGLGTLDMRVASFGGGNLVGITADTIGPAIDLGDNVYRLTHNSFISDSSIGGIRSTNAAGAYQGWLDAEIIAGDNGGLYNSDAHIHNIVSATDLPFANDYWATGSIGVIECGGNYGFSKVAVNTDRVGPGGTVDLIEVAGDWNTEVWADGTWPINGTPWAELRHGPGGDIRFIHVGGDIWYRRGDGYREVANPIVRTTPDTLHDDSGARIFVTPVDTVGIDDGDDDDNANVTPTYTPTYSWTYIPVDDSTGGVGGVVANFTIDGSAVFDVYGDTAQISMMDLSGIAAQTPAAADQVSGEEPTIVFTGSGAVDIFDLRMNPGDGGTTPIRFLNRTDGDVISGSLSCTLVDGHFGGDIGPEMGATGAWVHGHWAAPASPATNIEPQYGWFHNRINGLDIIGAVQNMTVDGSLGDLRITGTPANPADLGGSIGRLVVNADGFTPAGDWDGVSGILWTQANLISVDVGDGLADDGQALVPTAGIFATGALGTISIDGPRFERDGIIYGELDGTIVGTAQSTVPVLDDQGQPVLVQLPFGVTPDDGTPTVTRRIGSRTVTFAYTTRTIEAVNLIRGTGGARLTAIVAGGDFDIFMVMGASVVQGGRIEQVSFTGRGSDIHGAELRALNIGRVVTSAESDGIHYTTFGAMMPDATGLPTIELIQAGGPGMSYSLVSTTGGNIGTVRGAGGVSDFQFNTFISFDGMDSLAGRDLRYNAFRMAGRLESVTAGRDVIGNSGGDYDAVLGDGTDGVLVGSIGTFRVGGNFIGNSFQVATNIGKLVVEGDFLNSSIQLTGPTLSDLVLLDVRGDISGLISSNGRIGTVRSRTGRIDADIITVDPDLNGDVGTISAAEGFYGRLEVAGTLRELYSGESLGDNPATNKNTTQVFNIWGDLETLTVRDGDGKGDLFANVNVGGDVHDLRVDGTLFGTLDIAKNARSIRIDGALGGYLDIDSDGDGTVDMPDTPFGELKVYGGLNKLKIPQDSDIVADLTVGGSIDRINLRRGDIVGDITSRYGTIDVVKLGDGDLLGSLTAAAIGRVDVRGSILTPMSEDGQTRYAVHAADGGIDAINVKEQLQSNILAANGRLERLDVGEGVGEVDSMPTIQAECGMGRLKIRENVHADIISNRDIENLDVRGGDGEIGGLYGMVSAATDIMSLSAGKVAGVIRAQSLGKANVGAAEDAIFSTRWNMGRLTFDSVTDSQILAGLDVGADGEIGGDDDTLHAGDVTNLKVRQVWDASVLAAGVSPGPDGDFLTTDDNVEADGYSSLKRASVKSFDGQAQSAFLADTDIDSRFLGDVPVNVEVAVGVTRREAGTGGPEGNFSAGQTATFGNLQITLTGQGSGNYDADTGLLVLNDVVVGGKPATLTLKTTGAVAETITLRTDDDSALRDLTVVGGITLGDLDIDGPVDRLTAPLVADGSAWKLPGGVGKADLPGLDDVTVEAGATDQWMMSGALEDSDLTFDSLGTLRTDVGAMTGSVTTTHGGAKAIDIRDGDLDDGATITLLGDTGSIDIGGRLIGDVDLTHGDLKSLTAASNVTGTVDVDRGSAGRVTITGGDFGGEMNTAFRTALGVDRFDVRDGDFLGLLSTHGPMGQLSVGKGEFSGRAWSAHSINKVTLGNLAGGLVASSGDLNRAVINGDMSNGWLVAGFDPGDDPTAADESDNLRFDAFSSPNADQIDQPLGGSIRKVVIRGEMEMASIAAGVGPGVDGYFASNDDRVGGIGIIKRVNVREDVFGSANPSESYGIVAATEMPVLKANRNKKFQDRVGNFFVASPVAMAGNLVVTGLQVQFNRIEVTFNHPLDFSTIDANSFLLTVTDELGNTEVVLEAFSGVLQYDDDEYKVTLRLTNRTWEQIEDLGGGTNYELTIDGDVVVDNRGAKLDGEYISGFPTGDGEPGGDFTYAYDFGQTSLIVPSFSSELDYPAESGVFVGAAPAAVGMLVGYYDSLPEYQDLVTGTFGAEHIASYGDGETPGTGHVADYLYFNGIDDRDNPDRRVTPDLSESRVVAQMGLSPHPDNSVADFLKTSRSSEGLLAGETWVDDLAPGIEAYLNYLGQPAQAHTEPWGQFTWATLVSEINAGRPIIVSIDADGDAVVDHQAVAVGYDTSSYSIILQDPEGECGGAQLFHAAAVDRDCGIAFATLVRLL